MRQAWIDRFEGLARLPEEEREALVGGSRVFKAPAGRILFGHGEAPDSMLFVLRGVVRVRQYSAAGREIVLYRVEAGETCILTAACLMAYQDYGAEGVAETNVEVAAVPRDLVDGLIARSKSFRDLVLTAYSRRIADLIHVIDDVAFGRIDVRLAQRLTMLARDGLEVRATHQELSTELGTAREVVSRQMQEFQRRGWVTQSRGQIVLLDPEALEALAKQ